MSEFQGHLLPRNLGNTSGGGSGVTSVTASNPLSSSGGNTPNISFTGILPVANGGTGQSTGVDLVYATLNTASGATANTVQNSNGIIFNIPISLTDSSTHTWGFYIAGSEMIAIFGSGNGSGSIDPNSAEIDMPVGIITIGTSDLAEFDNIDRSINFSNLFLNPQSGIDTQCFIIQPTGAWSTGGINIMTIYTSATGHSILVYQMNDVGQAAYGVSSPSGNGTLEINSLTGIAQSALYITTIQPITILQSAATSGDPTGIMLTAGSHTGLSSSAWNGDIYFNLTRTIQFAGGNVNGSLTFTRITGNPTLNFTSASIVSSAIGTTFVGMPITGTNATFTNNIAVAIIGGNGALLGHATTVNSGLIVSPIGLGNGFTTITSNAAIYVPGSLFGNISLGNQTATLTNLSSISLDAVTYVSTTLTRTVTNPATLLIGGAPIAGANVTFTNGPYSLWVQSGNVQFNGNTSIGGALSGTVAILELISTTQGFLPPRMTTTQRNAITAVEGLIIYDTTIHGLFNYENGVWVQL